MTGGFADPREQVAAELARLELELARQVLRRRLAGRLAGDPDYRGLYVPDAVVDAILNPPSAGASATAQLAAADARVAAAREAVAARVTASRPGALPLPRLADEFGLSPLDGDILLLALAPELDQRFPALISWLQDDATARRPTAALAADLWADPYLVRARLDPARPLRTHGLVELVAPAGAVAPTLLDHLVVVPGRVVDHAVGRAGLDERLRGQARRHRAGACGVPLEQLAVPAAVVAELRRMARLLRAGQSRLATLTGPAGSGRRTAALAVAAALDTPSVELDGARVPADRAATALDLAVGEVRLAGATLVVLDADRLAADAGAWRVADRLGTLTARGTRVVATGAAPWYRRLDIAGGWLEADLPEPGFAERQRLWGAALAAAGATAAAADVAAVADAFQLGAADTLAAVRAAIRPEDAVATLSREQLAAAARRQSTPTLTRFARRVVSPYRWSDLVVPAGVRRQLDEVVGAVRHRSVVRDDWGFVGQRGIHVLFSGPSGTGKTMSAGLLAKELGLDLYAVDLAAVVSKYIGETEKNLDTVFAEGRAANAILLFDEADALFGRRSQVKDAHDRYANLEVAFLLQRIEDYDGVTVLATNLRANLDEAFARRIGHTVEFPAPDARLRARIWRVALPAAVPLADDVDLDHLAEQVELTGAGIRNAALAAAYAAAANGRVVGMAQLVHGIGRELQKTGRKPSRTSFPDHYDQFVENGDLLAGTSGG